MSWRRCGCDGVCVETGCCADVVGMMEFLLRLDVVTTLVMVSVVQDAATQITPTSQMLSDCLGPLLV